MEEKKKEVKHPATQKEKLSYEELENIAHQLSEQSRVLAQRLQEANLNNTFKRLDYLFKVLENHAFFREDFLDEATGEIEELIRIPEDIEGEDNEDVEPE